MVKQLFCRFCSIYRCRSGPNLDYISRSPDICRILAYHKKIRTAFPDFKKKLKHQEHVLQLPQKEKKLTRNGGIPLPFRPQSLVTVSSNCALLLPVLLLPLDEHGRIRSGENSWSGDLKDGKKEARTSLGVCASGRQSRFLRPPYVARLGFSGLFSVRATSRIRIFTFCFEKGRRGHRLAVAAPS